MKKLIPRPLPQDNQRYNVVRMRNMTESTPFINEVDVKPNERGLKPYDAIESERELKKLEEMRLRFILMASYNYHYPYLPLEIKPQSTSLISKLLNLTALKDGVAGMIKSIIF